MDKVLDHVELALFWLLIGGSAIGQVFLLLRLSGG
jgi:hypothetical protein